MSTDITQEQAIALVASYRTDVDRYRDRARSVATLLATASGALAAGLVFSAVGQAFPAPIRALGYGAICLLAVSVCFFLSASMYSLKDSDDASPTASPTSVRSFLDASELQTSALIKSITKRTKWGKSLGLSALFFLLSMAPLSMFLPVERLNVSVQLLGQPSMLANCPALRDTIEGSVLPADLAGGSVLIPVEVAGEQCGDPSPASPRTLYLQRSEALITAVVNQ